MKTLQTLFGKYLLGLPLLLLACFGTYNYLKPNDPTTTSDTITVTKVDTAWYQLAGKPKAHDSVFVPVPANIDTSAILQRFFNAYFFTDSLTDSNLVAVINDTISRNAIKGRSFRYTITRPQTIQTIINTTVNNPKLSRISFYGGAFVAADLPATFGPELILVRKNIALSAGYNLNRKGFIISAAWQIGGKK